MPSAMLISYQTKIHVPCVKTMFSSVKHLVGITVTFNKFIEGTKLARTNNIKLEIQLEKKRTKYLIEIIY